MDYLIADKIIIPREHKKYYSEKIIYLPNCYMCYDEKREISNEKYKREQFGLNTEQFVLAAFHRSHKITLQEIESWSNIIKLIPNSILWISDTNKSSKINLINLFNEHGVNLNQLKFAERMDTSAQHLARHACADLFIDTFKYNAQSTSIDSLWAGLPVITIMGKTFKSRVSSSFLSALGLTELIAKDRKEYEKIIISLSKDNKKLKLIKEKLETAKQNNPLFDSRLNTKNLEIIYKDLLTSS